ncbi:TPA: tail fiber assembly protein [Morganella morganii]|nr:tail fiber assembly protein [Morganella morganii]
MKYGRIEGDLIVEIIDFNPAGKFNESLIWIKVPESCESGWVVKDGKAKQPEISQAELTEQAEERKRYLIAEATEITQLWQTQLILGIITEEDKASLKEWMLYVQKVQAVDVSTAPDIVWPVKP